MPNDAIEFGNMAFSYEVAQIGPSEWHATLSGLKKAKALPGESLTISVSAATKELARTALLSHLRACFTLAAPSLSLNEIGGFALRWAWLAPSLRQRIVRLGAAVLVLLLLSPFFIDYAEGSSPIARNVRGLTQLARPVATVPDTGFLGESFMRAALNSARSEFWASGVSFRNLVTGNADALQAAIKRGVRVRVVLLAPESPLAQPDFIRSYSRTASSEDIRRSVERLVGKDGILTSNGVRGRDQVYLSKYAPIVPLVRVDDEFLVGFLVHVDRTRNANAYGSAYFRIRRDSRMGVQLDQHFTAMIQDAMQVQY